MESDMPRTVMSKSKSEVEFQYGGRLFFFQSGNSYISAVDWYDDEIWCAVRWWLSDDSDIIIHQTAGSTEPPRPPSWKCLWRHYCAAGGPIWTKFGSLTQNSMPITTVWSKLQLEEEFQYGGRLFFQTESSYILAVNWDMSIDCGVWSVDRFWTS